MSSLGTISHKAFSVAVKGCIIILQISWLHYIKNLHCTELQYIKFMLSVIIKRQANWKFSDFILSSKYGCMGKTYKSVQ